MPLISTSNQNRHAELRRALRDRRAQLDPSNVAQASAVAAQRLAQSPEFAAAQRIAGYIAVRGEADPCAALEAASAAGKSIFLPRIIGNKTLAFEPWLAGAPMRKNRLGIPEPEPNDRAAAADTLDLVIVPLVAFDASGTRIGQGGGYYDRAFAFRRTATRPLLAGFAYAFQECPQLPRAEWDIPLDLVVTERGIQRFSTGSAL